MWIRYVDKVIKYICFVIAIKFSWVVTFIKFKMNGIQFSSDFIAKGIPIINVNLTGKFLIGKNFILQSGKYYNMVGKQQKCCFIVGANGILKIGNNVGISNSTIICWNNVIIENNVRIGGGVQVYDTDFHSLNKEERVVYREVKKEVKTLPVIINEGAFVGAHSIILKGVTIGSNSIVGAGSVVTKSIPANQIWAGNPAKFIREIFQYNSNDNT